MLYFELENLTFIKLDQNFQSDMRLQKKFIWKIKKRISTLYHWCDIHRYRNAKHVKFLIISKIGISYWGCVWESEKLLLNPFLEGEWKVKLIPQKTIVSVFFLLFWNKLFNLLFIIWRSIAKTFFCKEKKKEKIRF